MTAQIIHLHAYRVRETVRKGVLGLLNHTYQCGNCTATHVSARHPEAIGPFPCPWCGAVACKEVP